MPTILELLGKSTPVSEVLAKKLGYVKAAIASRVLFYQQLEDNVCRASTATLATKLGMSKGTISTNLKWLLNNDWIVNTKPLVKGNFTNHYQVTKRLLNELARSGDERHVQEMNVTRSGDERKRSNNKEEQKKGFKSMTASAVTHSKSPIKEKTVKEKDPPPLAVEVYRTKAHKFPPKSVWGIVEAAVGTVEADLDYWGEVVENYILCGWYVGNIKTMLEFYERREIPGTKKSNGATNGTHRKVNKAAEPIAFDPYTNEYVHPDGRREDASVSDL